MWIQHLLVVLIVLAAGLSATWRLSGSTTRLRYVAVMKKIGGRRGPVIWLARRLEARLIASRAAGGCSDCRE